MNKHYGQNLVLKDNPNKSSIKKILILEIRKICDNSKNHKHLLTDAQEKLKDIMNDQKSKAFEVLYSAILLAIAEDRSGLEVLKKYSEYYTTNSEIEKIHVLAALVLLDVKEPLIYLQIGFPIQKNMSPQLYQELFN